MAPTIADLLGLELEGATGKVMKEILDEGGDVDDGRSIHIDGHDRLTGLARLGIAGRPRS